MPETTFSVSDLTAEIRDKLSGSFSEVWVEGEISNHHKAGSGHHYFTLKDSFAQLACVLFRGKASRLSVPLDNGQQVKVFGSISVYEARGQYQLIADSVQAKGHGELQAKFEALKRKLDGEGLFDRERKQPVPSFPTRVGVVTSPTGAAIRDMLNVWARRAPWLQIQISPCRVQGEGAAQEIALAISSFNQERLIPRVDLIVVARGGGSIEDLWAFNEECVGRAIAASEIPIISGVGHEIDFTIADFVADRREPTPSAAAENATPDHGALVNRLDELDERLDRIVSTLLDDDMARLVSLRRELEAREPTRQLESLRQTVAYLSERFESQSLHHLRVSMESLSGLGKELRLIPLSEKLDRAEDRLRFLNDQLLREGASQLEGKRSKLSQVSAAMTALSPRATLSRGFSMTLDEGGRIVTDSSDLESGKKIKTILARGELESEVVSLRPEAE
ncbi:MAG: exodeoxyribonuclease VII large subunit [Verrucomicrobiota bacterium]